jgi:hypothetical protein
MIPELPAGTGAPFVIGAIAAQFFALLTYIATNHFAAKRRRDERDADQKALAATREADRATAIALQAEERARAAQTRQWEVEDRRLVAALHAEGQQAIAVAIAENTAKTEQAGVQAERAFTEANHVNHKLEKLGLVQTAILADHQQRRSTDVKP